MHISFRTHARAAVPPTTTRRDDRASFFVVGARGVAVGPDTAEQQNIALLARSLFFALAVPTSHCFFSFLDHASGGLLTLSNGHGDTQYEV